MNNSIDKKNYNNYSFFKTQNKIKNRILNTQSNTNREFQKIKLLNLISNIDDSNNSHSNSNSNSKSLNNNSFNNSNITNNHYYLNMGVKRVLNIKRKYPNFTYSLNKEKGNIKSFILNKSPGHLNLFIYK